MLSRSNKIPHFHRHFVLITLRRGPSLENIALSPPCVHSFIHTQNILSTHYSEKHTFTLSKGLNPSRTRRVELLPGFISM